MTILSTTTYRDRHYTAPVIEDKIYGAFVYVVYHYIEHPIKRAARRIACSGHWGY